MVDGLQLAISAFQTLEAGILVSDALARKSTSGRGLHTIAVRGMVQGPSLADERFTPRAGRAWRHGASNFSASRQGALNQPDVSGLVVKNVQIAAATLVSPRVLPCRPSASKSCSFPQGLFRG
jgi:hypothetical protein